jgi:imidazole glycerol-phosphate synthase subunit HisH
MTTVGVIDCGISNVGSVRNAFAFLGIDTRLVTVSEELKECSHVVLPGDGSFPVGMEGLQAQGLDGAIQDAVRAGKPLLGICLGMQLLAAEGEEFGTMAGLGLTEGRVVLLTPDDPKLPVPQIGWNEVAFRRHSRLADGIGERRCFYFMQSYGFADAGAPAVVGTCDYGGPVVAVIEQDNVFGLQFHPEKSQRAGLRILANFSRIG